MMKVKSSEMEVGHLYLSEAGNLILVVYVYETNRKGLLWITDSCDKPKQESFALYRTNNPDKNYYLVGKLDGVEFLKAVEGMCT